MVKANPTTAANLTEKLVRHKRPGGCKVGACGGEYPKPCGHEIVVVAKRGLGNKVETCDGSLHAEVASDVGTAGERWLYVRCTSCGRDGTEEDL